MNNPKVPTAPAEESEKKHLLPVNLGKKNPKAQTPYDETTYQFPDNTEVRRNLAGLALWDWLRRTHRRSAGISFACTREAWKSQQAHVEQEAARLGLPKELLDAPIFLDLPRSPDNIWSFLYKYHTPYIDLLSVMRLADWAIAVDDFRQRLDPARLSKLLQEEEIRFRRMNVVDNDKTRIQKFNQDTAPFRSVCRAAEAAAVAD